MTELTEFDTVVQDHSDQKGQLPGGRCPTSWAWARCGARHLGQPTHGAALPLLYAAGAGCNPLKCPGSSTRATSRRRSPRACVVGIAIELIAAGA